MDGKRFIIPIFISHFGCPHRCVYCNQHQTARHRTVLPSPKEIHEEIEWYLRVGARKRRAAKLVQVAFYGGSFTALPPETQAQLLRSVDPFKRDGSIHSLRLSTRPDYISPEVLKGLKAKMVSTVELGVQSMDDAVLRASQRGYGKEDVRRAVGELHGWGFEVGIQLMVGLPEDTAETFASTVEEVIEMTPHFVRIYPTLIIKGTSLERWFRQGYYCPISLQEAITLTKGALQRFHEAKIPVIRVGLQPTPSLEAQGTIVAGPYHPAFRQLVEGLLFYERAASLLTDSHAGEGSSPTFLVAPQDISSFRGQGGHNIQKLKLAFSLRDVRVETDPQGTRGMVSLRL